MASTEHFLTKDFSQTLMLLAMITAMPYFLTRLAGSSYASSFASWLSITWTFMAFSSLACATWTAQEVGHSRDSNRPASSFEHFTVNGALQATSGAWFQTSVVALASAFGPDAIASYMTGGALVAVGVSLLKLATAHASRSPEYQEADMPELALGTYLAKASDGSNNTDSDTSYTIYFSIAASFIGSGIIAYAYLRPKIPHAVQKEPPQLEDDNSDVESIPTEVDYLLGRVPIKPVPISSASIWIVARKNAYYNIAVFYVFVVTLAVFPSITTSILSVNSPDESIIFEPVIFSALHFLNFNVADLVGRALVSSKSISPTSNTQLLLYSLARTAFIPLLLLCNVQHRPKFGSLEDMPPKPFFNSDIAYMLILFAFGVTSGHASTLVLMAAPSKVLNPGLELYESKTAARIAQFSLVGGLVVGSAASFGVRAIQCGCNPFLD
ncbi:hypothetical protein OPQ81_004110 [Rhizoctonia solani]|nr:hypothetical protein OPQ81_004110 [Rhizoctonia solani]